LAAPPHGAIATLEGPPTRDVDAPTKARPVFVAHCTPCHDGADEGRKPEALAVFDLAEKDYFVRVRTSQHGVVRSRLAKASAGEKALVEALLASRP